MSLGVFGGSFDPPHLGHLILAAEACHQLQLNGVLWVLTPNPPHKLDRTILPARSRIEMLQASILGNSLFSLSTVDIDRPPPHYAKDTVRILQDQHPDEALVYLMGGDSLRDLPRWHEPQQLLEACTALGVMRRPGDSIDLAQLEKSLPGISRKTRFVEAPLLDISASEIRQRIHQGRPYRYFVPEPVYEILENRKWYR
jgi:nicotinate-nucleotide adenylyltransferase